MPRFARVVVPNFPHHVTQRGSRKQSTFFGDEDYRTYIRLVAEAKAKAGVDIWAYCLMPNHVHLVVVPERKDSLACLCRDVHSKYAYRVNKRENWQGHLWQERFHSFPMDEQHLMAAVRYVELNPVRAGICENPTDWAWSSVHAHKRDKDDSLVNVRPMCKRVENWSDYLNVAESPVQLETLRKHTRTGRPAGSREFLRSLERLTGRELRRDSAKKGTEESLSP